MEGEREESDRPAVTACLDATLIIRMVSGSSLAFSESTLPICKTDAEEYATFRHFAPLCLYFIPDRRVIVYGLHEVRI